MKLIIDIPNSLYANLAKIRNGSNANKRVLDSVKNGIPLDDVKAENKGEWIEKAEDYYKAINEYGGGVDENTDYFTNDIACPKCLSKFSTIDNETERFNFCPNCGADMRGDNK